MELIDEIRADRERLRGKPWREVVSHIVTYYKFHILVVLAVLIALGSWIVSASREKETVLSGVLLNSLAGNSLVTNGDTPAFSGDFLEELSLDPGKYALSFRTNLTYGIGENAYSDYQSLTMLMSLVTAREVDFIAGDPQVLVSLAYQGYFGDLSRLLTREQQTRLEGKYLYIDLAVLEAMEAEAQPPIPDCRRPETMEKPVPVLLDLSESPVLRQVYPDTVALGIAANLPHTENTLRYLDYLTK